MNRLSVFLQSVLVKTSKEWTLSLTIKIYYFNGKIFPVPLTTISHIYNQSYYSRTLTSYLIQWKGSVLQKIASTVYKLFTTSHTLCIWRNLILDKPYVSTGAIVGSPAELWPVASALWTRGLRTFVSWICTCFFTSSFIQGYQGRRCAGRRCWTAF